MAALNARARELTRLAGSPRRPAGGVRLLRDGAEAFPAMLELIGGARHTVCFENFIFAGDATGRRFAAALDGAARRGVRVQVLYDPVGTLMVRGGSVARFLRREGVTVRAFRPLSPLAPWSWLRLRHRDHRKSLVVDGDRAIIGGLCISDHWSPSSHGGGGWRDTAVEVRGPLAADAARAFVRMWSGSVVPSEPGSTGDAEPSGEAGGWLVADGPGLQRVAALYAWLAGNARRSLEITDAYLVAPAALVASLAEAARRGVRVRLLLPGRNNHPLAGAASRRIYDPLLAAGAEVYEWGGPMVHAKTAVMDGTVALVGSSNLDPLSMHRNYELNLLFEDPATGSAMQRMFEQDTGRSRRVRLEEWQCRPIWQRWCEGMAGLFDAAL